MKEISIEDQAAVAAGLYIHVPFCQKKCPYCDFYSTVDTTLRNRYLGALELEMQLTGNLPLVFDTIYIGGGTPSVLEAEAVTKIIENAKSIYNILPESEITIEINPGTVTPEQFRNYRRNGINRVNIGVQSFREKNLMFLDRLHTVQEARQALEWARMSGFDRIGFDLIYGLPNQTLNSWRRDLETAVTYSPQHLSCYTLTFEPGTPMEKDLQKGRIRPPDEDLVSELLTFTVDFLSGEGYEHYEVSNFARAAKLKSRHNCKYWSFAPYIGLGPSAHSFIEPERYWNKPDVSGYIQDLENNRLPVAGKEVLDRSQLMTEAIFLGLRTIAGIDIVQFDKKFDVRFQKMFAGVLEDFRGKGLLEATPQRCYLTRRGLLLLDTIAATFVDDIQE